MSRAATDLTAAIKLATIDQIEINGDICGNGNTGPFDSAELNEEVKRILRDADKRAKGEEGNKGGQEA